MDDATSRVVLGSSNERLHVRSTAFMEEDIQSFFAPMVKKSDPGSVTINGTRNVPPVDSLLLGPAAVSNAAGSQAHELNVDKTFDDQKQAYKIKGANSRPRDTTMKLNKVTDGRIEDNDIPTTQQHVPSTTVAVPANSQELNPIHAPVMNAIPTSEVDNSLSRLPDRSRFSAKDTVNYIWRELGLPEKALQSVHLEGEGLGLASSFKIGHLAQSSIALSALGAAFICSLKSKTDIPMVRVPLQHAALEFKSERLYTLGKHAMRSPWAIGGIYKTSDGYVRIHDAFPHHREGALKLLGCSAKASREEVAAKTADWLAIDLETAAVEKNIVIFAMRSFGQWDLLSQAKAVPDFPIIIRKIKSSPPSLPLNLHSKKTDKCLRGLRVLELSRVIAAPVCGRTLAAHGADVLWITSPNLPDIPGIDRDLARGKRTCQLDLNTSSDVERLRSLSTTADVFIQGYRPTSIAAKGENSLTPEALSALNPSGLIYASFSAWGPFGPWANRRGFDSLVQTATGFNISEAEHFDGAACAAGKPLPAQALDHAGGYFLAVGILAALYRRSAEGGSYEVNVSLASTAKYLRSLGQLDGRSGFDWPDPHENYREMVAPLLEERDTHFGVLRALRHSATVDGLSVGYDIMPKPLGSDLPEWLPAE